MEPNLTNTEDYLKQLKNVTEREKQESQATAALTAEILKKLHLSVTMLPRKHQQMCVELVQKQRELGVKEMDTITISQLHSNDILELLEEEYKTLELRQENDKLRRDIERNNEFIKTLKEEIKDSKECLNKQNPDNVLEQISQIKQKLVYYEENYEKAKAKFSKLHVPEMILPKSLEELMLQLAALKEKEAELQRRAEDITLARQAKETLKMLMR